MFIQNRLASLVYKLAVIAVCLAGLFLKLASGAFAAYVLMYYTVLSGIFCIAFYAISAVYVGVAYRDKGRAGTVRFAPHFKGAVVMSMLLGVLIFAFEAGDPQTTALAFAANLVSHLLLPLMVLADWALFDRKGRFTGVDPLIWLVIPMAYYCIVLLAEQFGVTYPGNLRYPYHFINADLILWAPVLVNVFLLSLAYTAVGYMVFGADRLMGRQAGKAAAAAGGTVYRQADGGAARPSGEAPPETMKTLQDVLNNAANTQAPPPGAT